MKSFWDATNEFAHEYDARVVLPSGMVVGQGSVDPDNTVKIYLPRQSASELFLHGCLIKKLAAEFPEGALSTFVTIFEAAKTNTEIKRSLDQIITMAELGKDNGST